jgi:hypothetical protein
MEKVMICYLMRKDVMVYLCSNMYNWSCDVYKWVLLSLRCEWCEVCKLYALCDLYALRGLCALCEYKWRWVYGYIF